MSSLFFMVGSGLVLWGAYLIHPGFMYMTGGCFFMALGFIAGLHEYRKTVKKDKT